MPLNDTEKTQEMKPIGSDILPDTEQETGTEPKAVNFAEIVQNTEVDEATSSTDSGVSIPEKESSKSADDTAMPEDGDLQAQIDLLKAMIAEQKATEQEKYDSIRTDVSRNAINTNQTQRRAKKALIIAIIVAIVCAAIAGVLIFGRGLILPEQNNEQQATEQTTEERHDVISLTGGDHDHDWETNMVTVEAPLLTKQVEHAAEYEDKQVLHTVCNTCHKTIDGTTADHTKETGHASFTTNVPVTEKVKVKDAWTETVTVQEYQSKTVQNGEKCRICGELRNEKSMDELMAQLGFKSSVDE